MRELLPDHFFDLFNSASGIDAFTIAMLAVNGIVGITAQPHMAVSYTHLDVYKRQLLKRLEIG